MSARAEIEVGSGRDIIVGLDLGTTKICAIVAEARGRNIAILGVGTHQSTGLRRGIVVDMDRTTECVVAAIEEAETVSGEEIRSVFVGIAGGHVKSHDTRASVRITDGAVTEADLERIINTATATSVSADREIIHTVAGKYSIDGQPAVANPLGMHGTSIETDVHIVTGQVADTNNLVGCVRDAGLDVNGIVLEQIASGEAVLNEAEKELGVILVDCGGGTTDIAVFSKGCLKYTQNITLGGDHIDRDLSHCFNVVSYARSREIKEAHGVALADGASELKDVEIECSDNTVRKASQREVSEVIAPRMREILTLARDQIPDSVKMDGDAAKVVLTGGTFAMEGAVEMAADIFGMEARLGVPIGIDKGGAAAVSSPAYSTGVGLIHYGVKYSENSDRIRVRGDKTFDKIRAWMGRWFGGYF